MNKIIHSQTPVSSKGVFVLAVGAAALATGQACWSETEAPYVIKQTGPSYSEVTERILAASKNPHSNFVGQMASIYMSFSKRQELLGEEFEAAIFDDLDSLYEA